MKRRRFPRRSRLQRGFSLLEAMIAMAVFVIGALGLLRLMYSSVEGTKASSQMTVASTLGRSRLDELVTRTYDDPLLSVGEHQDPPSAPKNLGPAGTPFTDTGAATGEFGADDGWYARSWTVAENGDQTFKTIVLTVRWWDKNFDLERRYEVAGGKSNQ